MAEMSNKKNALNSGNKPKKSKSDLFRATVGLYLKQKSYVGSDRFRKSDFLLLQNKKQFMLQKMLEADLHGGNTFAYSNVLCITNNQHIVDQQFGKFSEFIESQNETIRTELRRFYGPVLCHFYLELIKAKEHKAAVELLRKYAHLIAPVESYDSPLPTKINGCSVPNDSHSDASAAVNHINIRFVRDANAMDDPELGYFIKLIQTLSQCIKIETAENDPDIAHFRSSKYEIHTTEAMIDVLGSFLEKRGHVLILNIVCTWIHVHIIDNEDNKWTEDNLFIAQDGDANDVQLEQKTKSNQTASESKSSSNKRPAEEPLNEASIKSEIANDLDTEDAKKDTTRLPRMCLQTLHDVKDEIVKAQTEFPRFVRIAEKSRGLTSADIDANECHMVAGFNSSIVQLWQMNQQTWCGKNLYRHLEDSTCRWDLNNCCYEEEDEIEMDIKKHRQPEYNDSQSKKFYGGKYADNSFNEFGGIELRGHGLGVTDVRFSAHYPLIYSASKDATMRSWRAENYSCAMVYRGHRYPIWCVDESPVGMYTATGSKDLTARLWSLEREFPLITYAGHTQDVECIAFHPNGNYIATGSADLSVRLWCVTSGKLMRVFSECKQPITSIAFSPDGKMLASGGEETKIRIFDLAAGSQLNELKEHSASVSSIAWSSSGRLLASACRDGSLRLWDVKKLTPMHDNSSSSSSSTTSSSSSSANRLMALNSNCQRLVKIFFNRNDIINCVGS